MNSVALTGILTEEPWLDADGSGLVRCTIRLAVPRHSRSGRREPGAVYVPAMTFGREAHDCFERLHRGDRIGLTGRLDQDQYVTPEGERRVDHSVLIDQLDLPPEDKQQHEEDSREQDEHQADDDAGA